MVPGEHGRGGGRTPRSATSGAARLLAFSFFVLLAAQGASCLTFRIFGNHKGGVTEECVGEWVSYLQWDVVLATVERNWRYHTDKNYTDAEVKERLNKFKRPLSLELGFVTFSPNPNDATEKPVEYYIRDWSGVIWKGPGFPVTQDELSWSGGENDFVGGKGPYFVCFKVPSHVGAVDIDISHFVVNVPEAIGTEFERLKGLSAEDARDMQPSLSEEELQYFAKEEHILALKVDTRNLGGAVYHAHNEQAHIKQIQIWQNNILQYVAYKVRVYGILEAAVIVACSVIQFFLLRGLFKNKKAVSAAFFEGGL